MLMFLAQVAVCSAIVAWQTTSRAASAFERPEPQRVYFSGGGDPQLWLFFSHANHLMFEQFWDDDPNWLEKCHAVEDTNPYGCAQ